MVWHFYLHDHYFMASCWSEDTYWHESRDSGFQAVGVMMALLLVLFVISAATLVCFFLFAWTFPNIRRRGLEEVMRLPGESKARS